jgi:hypothetical protein
VSSWVNYDGVQWKTLIFIILWVKFECLGCKSFGFQWSWVKYSRPGCRSFGFLRVSHWEMQLERVHSMGAYRMVRVPWNLNQLEKEMQLLACYEPSECLQHSGRSGRPSAALAAGCALCILACISNVYQDILGSFCYSRIKMTPEFISWCFASL